MTRSPNNHIIIDAIEFSAGDPDFVLQFERTCGADHAFKQVNERRIALNNCGYRICNLA